MSFFNINTILEVFTGSASQTEEIIEKHSKTMDKLDKKAKVRIYVFLKFMVPFYMNIS